MRRHENLATSRPDETHVEVVLEDFRRDIDEDAVGNMDDEAVGNLHLPDSTKPAACKRQMKEDLHSAAEIASFAGSAHGVVALDDRDSSENQFFE